MAIAGIPDERLAANLPELALPPLVMKIFTPRGVKIFITTSRCCRLGDKH
jgi:hypothetical protein